MDDKKRKRDEKLTDEIKIKIERIKNKKYKKYVFIGQLNNMIDEVRKEIDELDNELYHVCPHKWVVDPSQYEPCGPTPKICEYCDYY